MGKKKELVAEIFDSVTDGLKQLYRAKVRPIEELYRFGDFYSPLLTDGDFEAKPMVLLMGQYSVGKTSFIRYLLGRDFPGQHIGPEPTTASLPSCTVTRIRARRATRWQCRRTCPSRPRDVRQRLPEQVPGRAARRAALHPSPSSTPRHPRRPKSPVGPRAGHPRLEAPSRLRTVHGGPLHSET